MDKRLERIRDTFLCLPVAFIIFIVAERLGFIWHQWLLALALIAAASAAFAYAGALIRGRRSGAFNAYSIATGVAALVFVLKQWIP